MYANFRKGAHYLIRHSDGSYDVSMMEDATVVDPSARVAVRTMAISPFDPDTIYAGGFDANGLPTHDSAWILEAPLLRALHPNPN